MIQGKGHFRRKEEIWERIAFNLDQIKWQKQSRFRLTLSLFSALILISPLFMLTSHEKLKKIFHPQKQLIVQENSIKPNITNKKVDVITTNTAIREVKMQIQKMLMAKEIPTISIIDFNGDFKRPDAQVLPILINRKPQPSKSKNNKNEIFVRSSFSAAGGEKWAQHAGISEWSGKQWSMGLKHHYQRKNVVVFIEEELGWVETREVRESNANTYQRSVSIMNEKYSRSRNWISAAASVGISKSSQINTIKITHHFSVGASVLFNVADRRTENFIVANSEKINPSCQFQYGVNIQNSLIPNWKVGAILQYNQYLKNQLARPLWLGLQASYQIQP